MKKILLSSLLIVSCLAFGQKVKFKDDMIYVEGKEFLKYKEDLVSKYSFNLYSLDNKDLFYLKNHHFTDSQTGRYYYEVLSPDLNSRYFESQVILKGFGSANMMTVFIQTIFNSNVIDNGTVNFEKLDLLSKKIGFEYSKQELMYGISK